MACVLIGACGGGGGPTSGTGGGTSTPVPPSDDPVGIVDRAGIESGNAAWRDARASASPPRQPALALGGVTPGAELTVYFGTWCGDSRREVTRFWAALDLLGTDPPFSIRYVAVDRAKEAPDGLTEGVDLRYVPTFIVRRDGHEVGRIVESAPNGIETDLASLLRGEVAGVISGRTDL